MPCLPSITPQACAGLTRCIWCQQGIYRRADANVGLGRMKKALTDYKRAAQVNPRDPDLRKKLAQCEKEVKRIRFEEAVATPVKTPTLHACFEALHAFMSRGLCRKPQVLPM